jgi:hypothetical protein
MNTRRWLSVAAVTVASATLALVGAGGDALASNTAATGQIKACYKTGTALVPLSHVGNSVACPASDSTLTWNKVGPQGPPGPQGPAGVAVGAAGTSGTSVPLDQAQVLAPVLSTTAVTTGGTYYVSASVMLVVAQGDTVVCVFQAGGVAQGAFATVGPVANQTYETLPLSAVLSIPSAGTAEVACADYTSNAATSFYDGGITATLISNGADSPRQVTPARHVLPPHL